MIQALCNLRAGFCFGGAAEQDDRLLGVAAKFDHLRRGEALGGVGGTDHEGGVFFGEVFGLQVNLVFRADEIVEAFTVVGNAEVAYGFQVAVYDMDIRHPVDAEAGEEEFLEVEFRESAALGARPQVQGCVKEEPCFQLPGAEVSVQIDDPGEGFGEQGIGEFVDVLIDRPELIDVRVPFEGGGEGAFG